jgi:small nuclear ribonucleoprotein (snRNP)-like protein
MSLLSIINAEFIGQQVRVKTLSNEYFAGKLTAKEGTEIVLENARRFNSVVIESAPKAWLNVSEIIPDEDIQESTNND